ncbi:MAG: DNA helicase RecQ [Leptothrix ochracea]|uniref:DNA helicase RecQ n=1 Tax=Leptothrix ochracea TaxID=735331 RepID=UPI0034E1B914
MPASFEDLLEDPVPAARRVLHEVFGYPAFRGQQEAVVAHVAQGGDALVLMPTGGGKSLCYQVPAILRHQAGMGVTVVVSPLIALMHDQVGALDEAGVASAFLNSSLNAAQTQAVERDLLAGRLTLLYAAPERVISPRFLGILTSLAERGLLALFAIDEAHCVSQWGHDFRADYLQLSVLHEQFPQVPRLALTATADAQTQADILARLQLNEARRFVASFDRPNIHYNIVERDSARTQLLRFIRSEHADAAGIIYAGSRRKVEETAAWLCEQGLNALPYHAGMDAEQRRRNQDRFLREDGLIMVATIAFGMGIDKPDVRFVAHLELPKNIEGYYQETGRAGRDGAPAQAWMSYGLADVVHQRRLIDDSPADDLFKRAQRRKLDALLALVEAHDCRRVRLLSYFDEASEPCGNCDNCLHPPQTWDGTEAARKALSCIYRFTQHGVAHHSARSFGVAHLIDVLRGKLTDKVSQMGHESLSTFGIGADLSDAQWRAVMRQLVAMGYLDTEGEFNTLALNERAREVLRGEVSLRMKTPALPKEVAGRKAQDRRGWRTGAAADAAKVLEDLDSAAQARFDALKTWRAGVARDHNLPAYLVFQNITLAEMAQRWPHNLDDLACVPGVGAKKLTAYGAQILDVLHGAA